MFLTRRQWKSLFTIYGVFVSIANHFKGNYWTLEWRNKHLTLSHSVTWKLCITRQANQRPADYIDHSSWFSRQISAALQHHMQQLLQGLDEHNRSIIKGSDSWMGEGSLLRGQRAQIHKWGNWTGNMNLKLSIHNTEPIKYGVSAILCLHNMKQSRSVVDL